MRSNRGFTLLELLTVVAIIGILAAIALPSYQNQIRRSNRTAAQAQMMDAANKEAFYLSSQRQYTTLLSDLGITLPIEVTRFYTVTITVDNAATPPTFTITATPIAGTAQVADGAISLDSTGAKTPSTGKW